MLDRGSLLRRLCWQKVGTYTDIAALYLKYTCMQTTMPHTFVATIKTRFLVYTKIILAC